MKNRRNFGMILLTCVPVGLILIYSFSTWRHSRGVLPPVTISPVMPADVDPAVNTFQGNPIGFFDDYSWRAFLALVWPAKAGQRGVADTSVSLTKTGVPLVFETLKSDWELFKNDGSVPSVWESYDGKVPCSTDPLQFGDVVLASFSKFGNLGEAGFGDLVGALAAQNHTYVRYLTGFNQPEFELITSQQLYLRDSLNKHAPNFPNGSIDVKSAWIDMTGIAHQERYYTRPAWLMDPATGTCAKKIVGLVGLHIVQKTASRSQWIWSTFEQIDNIPQSGAQAPFTFNDGSGTGMPAANPDVFPLPPVPAVTYNVTRVKPIHDSTTQTNSNYRQALQKLGSVWQFYQLVATQWPVPGNSPANPGTPAFTFPGRGTDQTSFANTSLETFDQNSVNTSCMACHNATRTGTDFLWSLQVQAFPSVAPQDPTLLFANLRTARAMLIQPQVQAGAHNKAIQQLKAILQSNKKNNKK